MTGPVLCAFLLVAQARPEAVDPRLEVVLFARDPNIVHPIGLTFDSRGRLLVIESHTHFPPEDYAGPKADRIRLLADTDGDGRADRFETFYEGTRHSMDLATSPDGWVYLATRAEILRLKDIDGDGKADQVERIIELRTPGTYPHNGLSGLCFEPDGSLVFGLGENLGEPYKLVGSDGVTLSGGGEGGSIFRCTADGKKLHRVATGFWNPFGIHRDALGRLLAVDNDPDASPPCRLVEVLEGGDYGFQFRYGRAGRHPFQAWHGELPGTLPGIGGTGEGPCEVLVYDSDGLPAEYRGRVFVTAWADHQIQQFELIPHGASYRAEAKPLVRGPVDFRPVGLAVAPDGSLFVSDWVLSNYELHGRGAIWQVRWRDRPPGSDPKPTGITSADRVLRERALKEASNVQPALKHPDPLVRGSALLCARSELITDRVLQEVADRDPDVSLRALAVRLLARRGVNVRRWLDPEQPGLVRRAAVSALSDLRDVPVLQELARSADPFLAHAARWQFVKHPTLLGAFRPVVARDRCTQLLVLRRLDPEDRRGKVAQFLADSDRTVRFLAVKWIADRRLKRYREHVKQLLEDPAADVDMVIGCVTALARIDGKPADRRRINRELFRRAADPGLAETQRIQALLAIPDDSPVLRFAELSRLYRSGGQRLRREVLRTLAVRGEPEGVAFLASVAADRHAPSELRSWALVGLAAAPEQYRRLLVELAGSGPPQLAAEALRALVGVSLNPTEQQQLMQVVDRPDLLPLRDRVLGRWRPVKRPPRDRTELWLNWLSRSSSSPARGERVFYHRRLGGCFRCHRVHGRGASYGPDLSFIGASGRAHIVESLINPSATVAPAYQSWLLLRKDGRVQTGLLVRTHLDSYTYVDAFGEPFVIRTGELEARRSVPVSIMPQDLVDRLTDQELRDLVAWLTTLTPPAAAGTGGRE